MLSPEERDALSLGLCEKSPAGFLGDENGHVFVDPFVCELKSIGHGVNCGAEGSLDFTVSSKFRINQIVNIARAVAILKI